MPHVRLSVAFRVCLCRGYSCVVQLAPPQGRQVNVEAVGGVAGGQAVRGMLEHASTLLFEEA
eukprot:scaffold322341_cov32-Tisochrysis_lutea.AAC.2